MVKNMKKHTYITPATEITWFNCQCSMLASTNIPIGGSGGFDVKQEQDWNIWNDETEDYWNDDAEEEE